MRRLVLICSLCHCFLGIAFGQPPPGQVDRARTPALFPHFEPEHTFDIPTDRDDLRRHLEQKRWLEKTYLGINENPLPQTLGAIKVIKDHSKQWKITYAGDWHAELDGLLE